LKVVELGKMHAAVLGSAINAGSHATTPAFSGLQTQLVALVSQEARAFSCSSEALPASPTQAAVHAAV